MSTPNERAPGEQSCVEYESLILRAVDGCLDSDQQSLLDAHMATCATCREALADQRTLATLVATAFDVEPSAGFRVRVLAGLEPAETWFDRLDFRRWTWRISPVAAGLALAAWLVASSTQTATALGTTPQPAAESQAETLSWDEVMTDSDMVSLVWEAEVGTVQTAAVQESTQ